MSAEPISNAPSMGKSKLASRTITPEEFRAALPLIPELSRGDVEGAAKKARVALIRLTEGDLSFLNMALRDYVTHRLSWRGIAGENLSRQRKETERALKREKESSKKAELETTLTRLRKYQREKRRTRARHEGDLPMRDMIDRLGFFYARVTDNAPGLTDNGISKAGPCPRFLTAVLASLASKVPDQIEQLDPGLRARLRLSESKMAERLRKSLFFQHRPKLLKVPKYLGG